MSDTDRQAALLDQWADRMISTLQADRMISTVDELDSTILFRGQPVQSDNPKLEGWWWVHREVREPETRQDIMTPVESWPQTQPSHAPSAPNMIGWTTDWRDAERLEPIPLYRLHDLAFGDPFHHPATEPILQAKLDEICEAYNWHGLAMPPILRAWQHLRFYNRKSPVPIIRKRGRPRNGQKKLRANAGQFMWCRWTRDALCSTHGLSAQDAYQEMANRWQGVPKEHRGSKSFTKDSIRKLIERGESKPVSPLTAEMTFIEYQNAFTAERHPWSEIYGAVTKHSTLPNAVKKRRNRW